MVRWLLLVVDAFFCFLVGLITAARRPPATSAVGDLVAKTYVSRACGDLGVPLDVLQRVGERVEREGDLGSSTTSGGIHRSTVP